jgi:eukaryotic-like serine/threonine-protein kinase
VIFSRVDDVAIRHLVRKSRTFGIAAEESGRRNSTHVVPPRHTRHDDHLVEDELLHPTPNRGLGPCAMNLLKSLHFYLQRKKTDQSQRRSALTGRSLYSRSVTSTALLLKRQLWIWPIIAVIILSALAWGVRTAIEQTMRFNLESQLVTMLDVEVAMVEAWAKTQRSNAESLANDLRVREHIYSLLRATQDEHAPLADGPDALPEVPADTRQVDPSELSRQLRAVLGPAMTSHDYHGYFVVSRTTRILAASEVELIGKENVAAYTEFLSRVFEGQTVVCPPFLSISAIANEQGELRSHQPTMFVCAPVRDRAFQVVAALALRIRPDREFTRILGLGQIGNSGETYAFNKEGVLVSNSRFDADMVLLGILPDEPGVRSQLRVALRDPGVDITQEGRPKIRRAEMPLTQMAASAVTGQRGVDVDGYRDYRGVLVVGAWTWLDGLELGIATEMDHAEAYRPLSILQTTFWCVFALLVLAAIAILVFTIVVARLQREAQKAALEAKELGQYKLLEKLGAGAMGVVYKGVHAMLRRPTAIKMLNVDKVNDASIQRFEHEVQITCQLNHPNTIAIYDYGRTPEGVFYYAMEYLDGIDLQQLVEQYGPLPEGRVIHILKQICGSLYEAHSKGLVHRDIKPSNIMISRRGGEADVVKVLDFGLVKALDQEKQAAMTAANSLTGTPQYMSPEAIQSPGVVDACSDLYAVGAVGYFLLTGQPVFVSDSVVTLLQQHVSTLPIPPSQRLGKPVSERLEHALLACLEKNRALRPQTARMLAQMLDQAPTARSWTWDDADAWWSRHERGVTSGQLSSTSTTPPTHEQTLISSPDHHD